MGSLAAPDRGALRAIVRGPRGRRSKPALAHGHSIFKSSFTFAITCGAWMGFVM